MSIMDEIIAKVKGQNKVVVLPEGQDTRVIAAAAIATKKDYAKVIVLATAAEIEQHRIAGLPVDAGFTIIDWNNSDWAEQLAMKYFQLRESKGVTIEDARKKVKDRLYFGMMMVTMGYAEGLVAGSISSTGDMLRASFQCVGTAPGIKTASAHFIMELQTPTPTGETTLMFSDCAVNPDPTSEQLSDIAMATIDQFRTLVGGEARVAFLSFSSYASAVHPNVEKVASAVKM
ncbi:MAG: phosphate acyltransferase, partial [Lentisphaeria bacterium]